jgi:hypothetical protein
MGKKKSLALTICPLPFITSNNVRFSRAFTICSAPFEALIIGRVMMTTFLPKNNFGLNSIVKGPPADPFYLVAAFVFLSFSETLLSISPRKKQSPK